MTTQTIHEPAVGRVEFEINRGMERDGIGQRVCLHPDRTLTGLGAGELREWLLECDYCPAFIMLAEGLAAGAQLPAWYWRVET